jgi:hypothetical protein
MEDGAPVRQVEDLEVHRQPVEVLVLDEAERVRLTLVVEGRCIQLVSATSFKG